MTVNLSLTPEEEAQLERTAEAQGVTLEFLVQRAVKQLVTAPPESRPVDDLYGVLAKYGPGPTAEEIDENRREMFRNFARDDAGW